MTTIKLLVATTFALSAAIQDAAACDPPLLALEAVSENQEVAISTARALRAPGDSSGAGR